MPDEIIKTLLDIFLRYSPPPELQEIMSEGVYLSKTVNTENKTAEVYVSFSRLIDKTSLYKIENGICTAYNIKYLKIYPKYPAELFEMSYIPQILLETECVGIVSRGFFNNYEIENDESKITIKIPYCEGGVQLLYDARTPNIISQIIKTEFGITREVEVVRGVDNEEVFYTNIKTRLLDIYGDELSDLPMAHDPSLTTENELVTHVDKRNSIYDIGENEMDIVSDTVYRIGNMTFDIENAVFFYGNQFGINPVPIIECNSPRRSVVILGEVLAFESRQNRNGDKTMISFAVTDNKASVTVKFIALNEKAEPILKNVRDGKVLAVKGNIKMDNFDNELVLSITDAALINKVGRTDEAEEKRVELHLHTVMSAMDATIIPADVIKLAKKWGHKAIAITDHGNVQSFPEAMIAAEKVGMKVIYGLEAYFVDDTARAVYGETDTAFDAEFVVFDIETTGLSSMTNKITEIGAVLIQNGEVLERFNTFVNPEIHIPDEITKLTGIDDSMVSDAPLAEDAVKNFLEFAGTHVLIAHNAGFDISFIRKTCDDYKIPFNSTYIDTVGISRYVNADIKNHKLDTIAKYFNLGDFNHHRASDDAEMLAIIFFKMTEKLKQEGLRTIEEMAQAMAGNADPLKLRTYHMILLVKNKIGLKNIYKLISKSYLKYYKKCPRIPKTTLNEYRDGLIIGSACEAGELFTAILDNKPHSDIVKIAEYYDYLEIQPICNNEFLVSEGKVANDEALKDLNQKIVALGDELNKPVVATCDAHFIEKSDEIYRKILLNGMKFSDSDRDIGLYFRTTPEMLDEFEYLGKEKAYDVVIKNTNLINDMIEEIRPIPKGTYTPKMEGAEEQLQEICWNRAKSLYLYGENLPDPVSSRLEKELTAIIKHGFAVLYMIAKKLVEFSESQGYLVGSRGSVGSSFVAAMSGISEVNPLPPHYYCPKCRYSDFITDGSYGSGFDLPDKNCPKCGTKLIGEGHDIPFETFLGFYGDKSPDIDLNFSGEVQGKVHKYTETLFGSENVFKAGTIGTLASKTAYGFVMKYLDGKNMSNLNKADINRLVNNCVGVKRTTGQHPGGIIVVPREYDIYDFTPVQHPADDANSAIVTTHFQFSYLHDTILKLDELGHDVPSKYKMFENYTNTSVLDVPMNDPAVYELFKSTNSLKIKASDIDCELGTLGLPEMGTRFIQQVLVDAKPQNFADLMQISGLTHGTDVWLGNAQNLIKNNICDISHVIGTRDGIMLDLIRYGLENSMAFKIMEFVRKNKNGLPIPDNMIEAMKEKNVPQWYIDSCQKIKYMFPKAHAAAYVMSAIRIGWYKVHRPLEFYAAFFTVAPGGFDGSIVMKGKGAVVQTMKEIQAKGNEATQKESDMYTTFQLVNEFYARGLKFLPVDLFKSDSNAFLPENGKVRLPFSSLPGLGENAAVKIMKVCRDANENVISVEDLQQLAKLSSSVIDILRKNNVFHNISETNQISFF